MEWEHIIAHLSHEFKSVQRELTYYLNLEKYEKIKRGK